MLALGRSDLKTLVPMRDAIELMKVAFAELSAGRAESPLRSVLEVNHDPSMLLMMPGYVPAEGALGFKAVSVFQGNPARNLPIIHAVVCLFDHVSGQPLAIMDGSWVTALRTGAVSGAATDLLARPDANVLTVIGAGVQGVTQAAAVCAVRPIEKIIAVDRNDEILNRFIAAVSRDWPELASRVSVTTDAADAVRQADVICTATTARQPVFDDRDVRPGTHINAVGAFTPEMQEIPFETVGRSGIWVDEVAAALAEAGDLIKAISSGVITQADIEHELGNLAAGREPGRHDDAQVTFFKSVGNAVQDVVVARRAVDLAQARGVGQTIDLS